MMEQNLHHIMLYSIMKKKKFILNKKKIFNKLLHFHYLFKIKYLNLIFTNQNNYFNEKEIGKYLGHQVCL